MPGIPFIGENGFYPSWVRGAGRWVLQRTLVSVGGLMSGYAEMVALRTPGSDQVIVWVPRSGGFVRRLVPGALHEERQEALRQLANFALRCYGEDCRLALASPQQVQSIVSEAGLRPEQWRLQCPTCGGQIGPDLSPVAAEPIVKRWEETGRPTLDNPAASAAFRSSPGISDLPEWIRKNEPSHLELAYLGQQLWPNAHAMLDFLTAAARGRHQRRR